MAHLEVEGLSKHYAAERVIDASSRAARTEERALSQRLANAEAENERLRRELAEAEQKLDAITSIERSIRAAAPAINPPSRR